VQPVCREEAPGIARERIVFGLLEEVDEACTRSFTARCDEVAYPPRPRGEHAVQREEQRRREADIGSARDHHSGRTPQAGSQHLVDVAAQLLQRRACQDVVAPGTAPDRAHLAAASVQIPELSGDLPRTRAAARGVDHAGVREIPGEQSRNALLRVAGSDTKGEAVAEYEQRRRPWTWPARERTGRAR